MIEHINKCLEKLSSNKTQNFELDESQVTVTCNFTQKNRQKIITTANSAYDIILVINNDCNETIQMYNEADKRPISHELPEYMKAVD